MKHRTSVQGNVDLRGILVAHQVKLLSHLAASKVFTHPTAQGDATEYDWCKFLRDFLPTRYQVSKAFVLDAGGSVSDQLDVVIHDRHFCPLFFEKDGHRYIPAEAVYAVFEVKPELNRANIEYASQKIESVRRLRRTSSTIVDRGLARAPREPFQILGGVLTGRSSWNPALGPAFESVIHASTVDERLDIGIALASGAFTVAYEADLVVIERSDDDTALMFFALKLFGALQALGSPNAIDVDAYARSIQATAEGEEQE